MRTSRAILAVAACWLLAVAALADAPKGRPEVVNLALRQPACQSSIYVHAGLPLAANLGVDGIIGPWPAKPGFETKREVNPWWQVDLGAERSFDEVHLHNVVRAWTEGTIESQARAGTIQVLLSSDGTTWAPAYRHDGKGFDVLRVPLRGAKARYVRVQLAESNFLHLREVEVYGLPGASAAEPPPDDLPPNTPRPPRNGNHSVQALFGGRNEIPMCIVPPRQYVDGKAIPPGTPCSIVIYRSVDDGKPGSYTQQVGRAQGRVTKPDDLQAWIDVTAVVPPGGANGGVIYLASSAVVGGLESDLNNQWLTIVWSPGKFEVKEYPAAGSRPGAPPGRQPASSTVIAPLGYPPWALGDAGSSVVVRGKPFFSDLGRPGVTYPVPAASNATPAAGSPAEEEYARWMRDTFLVGTVHLEVGETRNFMLAPVNPKGGSTFDMKTRQPTTKVVGTRTYQDTDFFVSAPAVVQDLGVKANILEVKALGPGSSEVWAKRALEVTKPDGTHETEMQLNIWIVLVSQAAVADYKRHQTGRAGPPPSIDIPMVALSARAVMRGSGKPVVGAVVSLLATDGRAYSDPKWVTNEKGSFTIVAMDMLKSAEYEVMVQKRSRDTGAVGVGDDLWPVRKYKVRITKERAAKEIFRLADITMDYARNIDFSRR